MSPEFVVAAGWVWRLMGKKVGLWYTHKSVTVWLRIAEFISHDIFTASKESFRLPSRKLIVTGHGIDTEFFSPDKSVIRGKHLLSVGRLMKSKRHDIAIEVAAKAGRELRIAGDGPEEMNLRKLAETFGANVQFLGGLKQTQLRDEYRKAAFFIHTSETGSLDKVVLEALACDVPVATSAHAFHNFPVQKVDGSVESFVQALKGTSKLFDRASYIKENHSLSATVHKIIVSYV